MLLKIVYLLTCRVLGLAVLVFRGGRAKDAELLMLSARERAVLCGRASRVRYEPADRCGSPHQHGALLYGLAAPGYREYTALPHLGIAKRVPDGEHDGNRITVIDLDRELIDRKTLPGRPDQRIRARRLAPRRTADHQTDPDRKQSSILGQSPATLWRNAARGGR